MGRVKFPGQVKDENNLELDTMMRHGKNAVSQQGRIIATERMLESLYGQGNVIGQNGFNFSKAICSRSGKIIPSHDARGLRDIDYDTDYKFAQTIAGHFAKNPSDSLIIFHPDDNQPHYLRCERVGNDYVYNISDEIAEPDLDGQRLENWKKEFIQNNKEELDSLKNTEAFQKAQNDANKVINSEYDRIKEANPDFGYSLSDEDIDLHANENNLNEFMKEQEAPKPYVPQETPELNRFLNNNQSVFTTDVNTVVNESQYDPDLANKIAEAKIKTPEMDYDDFVKRCSIPEEKQLDNLQRYTRQDISKTAVKNYIKASQEYANARPSKQYALPASDRQFKAVMCSGDMRDRKQNEQVCELFSKLKAGTATDAEKVKMVKTIESRYKQILRSDDGTFDRTYNDKELAENWGRFHENVKGAGMEYLHVKEAFNKLGLKVDPKLEAQMDQFHAKADAFNMKYQNRMNYIASSMYQFGGEEEITKTYEAARTSQNPMDLVNFMQGGPELTNIANVCDIAVNSDNSAIGIMGLKDQCKSEQEILGIRDNENNEIAVDSGSVGKALKEGKELTIFYKDGREPRDIKSPDTNSFPPKIESKATSKSPNEIHATDIMIRFDQQAASIKSSTPIKAEQDLKEDILMDQYKLSAIANNIEAKGNKKEFMRTMATMAARLTVQEKLNQIRQENKGKLDKDVAEFYTSPENIKRVAKELVQAGVVKEMAKNMPKNNLEILQVDNDGLFNKLTEATKSAEKAQNEPQIEAPQAEKQAQTAQPAQRQM